MMSSIEDRLNADKYYGPVATGYDADRCHSLRWAREQIAVSELVDRSPVLDVPIGTGRYVKIYRDKGFEVVGVDKSSDMLAEATRRYPCLDVRLGDIQSLPFSSNGFPIAVCTRLLDWLAPDDMTAAVKELRRVAEAIVVTLRHGEEGRRVNYTHDLARFYGAIDGLHIEQRRVTEITDDGVEEIFKIRPPTWDDVLMQFEHHGHTPAFELQRMADSWKGVFWSDYFEMEDFKVSAEYWDNKTIGAAIDAMVHANESYKTDLVPRAHDRPITIMVVKNNCAILDGRRRANFWKLTPGRYPVLALRRR